MANSQRILFCPLDWGLGHATRIIPVIREFEKHGCKIFVGSSGGALELLKIEFPDASFFELPSYSPQYSDKGFLSVAMLKQLPKFRKAIGAEHTMLGKIVDENRIDLVVSDNRYGCWSPKVKSVLITHQVNLLMPRGFEWMSRVVNSFLHSFIKKFNEVWIPDDPDVVLTTPFINRHVENQKYIGWLSRFGTDQPYDKEYDIVALVSGPEPQRTIFELILTEELKSSGLRSLLVTGQPGASRAEIESNLQIVGHLNAAELQKVISSAKIIIARSGYSTVMDLIALGKNAIFVPTPQQPEQIFLAEYLKRNGIVYSERQENFSLMNALQNAKEYKGLSCYKFDQQLLNKTIDSILT